MKVIVQRAKDASVTIEDETVGSITNGLVLLIGVHEHDESADITYTANKIANLRIFTDDQGKMNDSVLDCGGDILAISQFTLYGDTRKGRRPNFMAAAHPEKAQAFYESFIAQLRDKGIHVETGEFGAMMAVHLTNDGPVTLEIDSMDQRRS